MTLNVSRRPALHEPIVVAAFEGWNDAANAASDALRFVVRATDATEFANIDPEPFYDMQVARPEVRLVDGVVRSVQLPTTTLHGANGTPDLVLVLGTEPNLCWPAFCDSILRTAREFASPLVVTLGALLGDVPHTRDPKLVGTANDEHTIARLGLSRSNYEGPTGIVGALHDAARRHDIESASLWYPVPHYVATPPNAKATYALLERLGALIGLELELSSLAVSALAWQQEVDSIVAADPTAVDYVRTLETRFDEHASGEVWDFTDDDTGDGDTGA